MTMISFFFVVFLLFPNAENAKILSVLPLPAKSHFVMFNKLFEGLAAKGHEVDVITPVQGARIVPGLNIIPMEISNLFREFKESPIEKLRSFSVQRTIRETFVERENICAECFKSDVMKKLRYSKKKYDILILEVFTTDCIFGYAHIFKIPVVAVTTSVDLPWGSQRLGNPDNPAYISNYYGKFIQDATLYERLLNTFQLIESKLLHIWFSRQADIEAKKFFGEDLPPLEELVSNSSIFLLNSHFSSNQPRPNIPNVIEVAGLHIETPKPLKKQFTNFIGNSKFIYFSLGSLLSPELIPLDKLQNIMDALKKLQYKVIWKADMDKVPKNLKIPSNILVEKWMPQLDILCHPNILFFITHNGLMSTQEAVYCGVPMLSIPAFADQFLNADTMVKKGVAIEVAFETTSTEELGKLMKDLIENKKYKENAVKLSEQFKDRPRKPLDEAVYWIEYVLNHNGAPQLKSYSKNLYWYEYYLVDVIAIFALIIVLLFLIIYAMFKLLLKFLYKKESVKQKLS